MVDLSDRGEAIDATTVRTILDNQGDLQNIGGLSTLLRLSTLYQPCKCWILCKKLKQRKLRFVVWLPVDRVCKPAYEASSPADEIIARAEKGLIDVRENRSGF